MGKMNALSLEPGQADEPESEPTPEPETPCPDTPDLFLSNELTGGQDFR